MMIAEVIALAGQKGALFWKIFGMRLRGQCLACTGRADQAVKVLTATANAYRSTGSTALVPLDQLYFAKAIRNSANSLMLAPALMKQWPRWRKTRTGCGKPRCLGDAGFETSSVHLLNKGQPSIKGVKGVTGKEHVTTLDLMLCLKTRGGRGQVMSLTNPRWFVTPVSGSVSEASRTACPSSCFPALSSFPRQFRRRG